MGDGLDFTHLLNISLTILFLTILSVILSPLFFSTSVTSFGKMSKRRTLTPILAK